ncbi:MAG: hypothetical protein LAT61_15080 [Alcanivorax sp.]|nr:hypothetical protein [Alcanivorax sp.]
MNVNDALVRHTLVRHSMLRLLISLACLCSASALWSQPADTDNALTRRDGELFFQRYQDMLSARSADQLSAMIAEDAPLRIALQQPGDEPAQTFTLTRARFVQLRRTLWHFATDIRQRLESPRYTPQADGSLKLTFTETERHTLFNRDSGQRNVTTLTLARRDGEVVVVDLFNDTTLW